MEIFFLVLVWVGLGLCVGLLGVAARLMPPGWRGYGWLALLALALGAALLGGWLGFWLLGRVFASACALWIAVVAICVPRFYDTLSRLLAQVRAR